MLRTAVGGLLGLALGVAASAAWAQESAGRPVRTEVVYLQLSGMG